MNYLTFILSNPRFLGYGFVMLFFSSFGQTYFVAEYVADIRVEFDLSHGDVGLFFSGATLLAGGLMAWVGRKIDDMDLRLFTTFVCCGLIAGCLVLSFAPNVGVLFFAFFLLRLSGQGLMVHASYTSMARYFEKERGKAMSVASMGMSIAQTSFPYIAFTMVAALGWRDAWLANGVFLSIVLVPLTLWLLIGHKERHERFLTETDEGIEAAAAEPDNDKGWVRRVMLRDPRYFMIMPLAVAMPFIMTGLIFHRQFLTESKAWPDAALPEAFMAFALSSLASTIVVGGLVDKYGVKAFMPAHHIFVLLGLACIVLFDTHYAAYFYMGLCGFGLGAGVPVGGSMWPAIFGARHIGTVRAVNSSVFMIASALAPYTMGVLFDWGVSIQSVVIGSMVYLALAIALVFYMVQRYGLGRTETVR
jgi:MFS family permease